MPNQKQAIRVERLPVTASDRVLRTVVGVVAMIVGLGWAALMVLALVYDPPVSAGLAAMLGLLLVSGVAIALGGFVYFTGHSELTITSEEVRFLHKALRKREQWVEPLSNYDGVVLAEEVLIMSRGQRVHTHKVWLHHPQESRRILLRREPSYAKARAYQE